MIKDALKQGLLKVVFGIVGVILLTAGLMTGNTVGMIAAFAGLVLIVSQSSVISKLFPP